MNYSTHSKKEYKITIENMVDNSFNTERKFFLRDKWNKPLIKFLSKNVKDKLVYMGLPSPNGDDVNHWIEFIKVVIAFQCREYSKPSDSTQSREDVEKLEEFLRALERESKLESYVVYDGYLEEVVLKGRDNSPQSIHFEIQRFITLYNLDFCNDIASPIEFVDELGDLQTVFKFDAIKRLISIQKEISQVSNRFLFLLTVHCNYNGKELENFLNNPPNETIKAFLAKYHSLKDVEKNSRIVRLFVVHLVHQHFLANDFSPKILPVIRYKGIKDTPLLHFVVLGIHSKSKAGATPIYQQFDEILNQKFVDINESEFINSTEIFAEEIDVPTNPVEYFSQSKTFDKLWK
nr:hypothetical protein [Cytophagales bacterium]